MQITSLYVLLLVHLRSLFPMAVSLSELRLPLVVLHRFALFLTSIPKLSHFVFKAIQDRSNFRSRLIGFGMQVDVACLLG